MQDRILLLDCTLRDGGYVNNWEFGQSTALCVAQRVIQAGVDIVELGFLDDRNAATHHRTLQPTTADMDAIYEGLEKKNSMLVAMIDYGTCSIDSIAPCEESILDGIRIIFKRKNLRNAIAFGKQIKAKGYKVFMQLVSITDYDDAGILEMVECMKDLEPYGISIVDTYGLMHKEEMMHYFYLMHRNLPAETLIGYHPHNNFQLAYSNAIELVKKTRGLGRTIVVDGTVYGMGKSAGNAPLELLSMYLNEHFDGHYDINQILEAIDGSIMPIYKQNYWGYSLNFYLSALNDCHPNYITYLLGKKTLSVKAINEIIGSIDQDKKLAYSKEHVAELYQQYLQRKAPGESSVASFTQHLSSNEILLLAPGSSIISEMPRIQEYIEQHRPTVVALNCIPKSYPLDYVFICNSKRLSLMYNDFRRLSDDVTTIATSNVENIGRAFDHVLDFEAFLDKEDPVAGDNALVVFLNFAREAGIRTITLAGFDGFSPSSPNYFEGSADLSKTPAEMASINGRLREHLNAAQHHFALRFLTHSVYNDDAE
ncbi:MAG: 3-hydroxy-3-methylglutaryl-CoA lyase [Clostridiales bacterium]|nr:3-hydroxy-3-methylglutaryl-CoA lyase [Clostridiales bacterium]MBE5811794.1 3-hydroxy-3-methylglutaryl-CoA lyase [Clostridiales bacterium]